MEYIGGDAASEREDDTPERQFWSRVIESVAALSEMSTREIDFHETMEDLREETEEDALTLLYNYSLMITVPEGESSDLSAVENFLRDNGYLEE